MSDRIYMPCSMNRVPRITSYAEARAHYGKVRSWFDCGDKPIKGQLRYDNMRMREFSSGAIVFQLYSTRCVTYNSDGTIHVKGWATMSTNAFVDRLTPDGITHNLGRKGWDEPILHLRHGDDTLVVHCAEVVHLERDDEGWVPVDESGLVPFSFIEIDAKKARAANRHYRIQQFLDAAPMVDAFTDGHRDPNIDECIAALEHGNFVEAIYFCERTEPGFNRPARAVCNQFIEQVRNRIYDDADALTQVHRPVLTIEGYKQYLRNKHRFENP
jgi:hypothetical protein